jgi:Ca2+-binding RTX toxin-like protein
MADITAALRGTILEFDSSGFDATRVHAPTVTKVGDSYVMLYAGLPFFNNIQIGLATSDDGQTWTKYSSIPVISNGSSQSWASFREVPATLLHEDGLYKLWFNGSNRNLATDPGFGSGFGYATSPDGVNWTFASDNPIRWELNSPSGNGFGLTEVVSFGGQYHAYFVDRNPTGDILYHATSSDGVHFSGQTPVGVGSGYVLEAATTVGRAVFGVWSNGGARYYGRSTDGVNFTIEGAIQNLPFGVNDVRIDGGKIEFYGTAGVGNINWSFGNAVIQHATATLPDLMPPDFPINTTTEGDQSDPSVTALSDGRFVVSWSSYEASSGTWDIRGRVFNADGSPAGDDFVVNSTTANAQEKPSITDLDDGGFVVSWSSNERGGPDWDIRTRIFNAEGSPTGEDFIVNTGTVHAHERPSITSLGDGRFLVSWTSDGEIPPGQPHAGEVRGRVYNADGSPAGDQFVLYTKWVSTPLDVSVASLSDGRFVASWQSYDEDVDPLIRARLFNADGSPVSEAFVVNAGALQNPASQPSVTGLDDGRFVVSWKAYGFYDDGDSSLDIIGRVFNADGTSTGYDFIVNATTAGEQAWPSITTLSNGRFMVSWMSWEPATSSWDIRGRVFNPDGSPSGEDFVVNKVMAGEQQRPSIAALGDGRVVVSWQSDEEGSSTTEIRATILSLQPSGTALDAVDDTGGYFAFNTLAVFSPDALLANDAHTLGDELSIASVSGATHGTVVLNVDGNPVFTPAGNYSGAASFSYTISDGHGTSTANVQFTVDAPAQILIGGPGNDSLIGSAGNDRLSGSDGADVLVGNEGNDWMSGGRGHDVLFGGTAADTMLGGADNDIYYIDDAGDVAVESKNAGIDEVRSSINFVLGSNVENLVLSGAVNGTGNKLDNHITGSDDANVLGGGIGRDVLEGGRGDDILTGGRDWDLFVFKPHFGHDIITDFAVTRSYSAIGPDHDVLVFDHSIFADAASLLAHSLDTADGVLVTADAGDSVLLKNTTLAALQAHPEDFHFI